MVYKKKCMLFKLNFVRARVEFSNFLFNSVVRVLCDLYHEKKKKIMKDFIEEFHLQFIGIICTSGQYYNNYLI